MLDFFKQQEHKSKKIVLFNVDDPIQNAFLFSFLYSGHSVIATYKKEATKEMISSKAISFNLQENLTLLPLSSRDDFSKLAKHINNHHGSIDTIIFNPSLNCYGSVNVLHASNFSQLSKNETTFILNINEFLQPLMANNSQFIFVSNPFIPKFVGFENNNAIYKQLSMLFKLTFPSSKVKKIHFKHSALPDNFWNDTFSNLPHGQLNIQTPKDLDVSDFYDDTFPSFEISESILNKLLDVIDSKFTFTSTFRHYKTSHIFSFYKLKINFYLSTMLFTFRFKKKRFRKKKSETF